MSQVDAAIAAGRCALAVSGDLLRSEGVMLALKERAALRPMALSGPAVAPVVAVSDAALARAVARPGGVLAIVEPGPADAPMLTKLAALLGASPNKPLILVVARKYNPLEWAGQFRGFKIENVKERGQDFVAGLAKPPAEEAAPAAEAAPKDKKKAADPDAPRFAFVGREDEHAQISEYLKSGGPIVVSGPRGIGRTQLVEHAVTAGGYKRLPDLALGRGVGADALLARLAEACRVGGSSQLADVLKAPHTPIQAIDAALASLQEATGLDGQVMVVQHLQVASGRDGSFFRKSRLELLVETLLTATYPLRLVFTSVVQPVFFREGRAANLRRIELGGIKGRFFFDIFDAYRAPEFPREKFGPISEKLAGNPLAARTFAIAARHDATLVDNEKFFRMEGADDTEAIEKQIAKRVERLDGRSRETLALLAHLRYPVDGQFLADLGITRKERTFLIGEGLVDMLGTEEGAKRFRVHAVVQRCLGLRETSDFNVLGSLGELLAKRAGTLEGVEKLALQQEANRCFSLARRFNDLIDTGYPDYDAIVESTIGLVRSREPRFDLAAQRVAELLRRDPSNADAHLLKLEVLRHQDAKADAWKAAAEEAITLAPVPEVFHEVVTHHLARNARGQAIKVLETAVEVLPDQSRLRCRLAALLSRQGRRPEAIDHLQRAMELDPMLPDAYGLLGTLRRDEGAEKLDEAETLLREAVRLAPTDVVQTSRLIWLLLDIHKGVSERRDSVTEEIKTLLDGLIQADKNSWEAHLLYAVALREMNGDLERAGWFLGKARKLASNRRALGARFELEGALLDVARGKLADAERNLRRMAKSDPSNPRIFAGIAAVLEKQGQPIAAHAELMRAIERTSPFSLDRQVIEMGLARLRAAIESGVAFVAPPPAEPVEGETEASVESADAGPAEPAPWEGGWDEGASSEPSAEESPAADDDLAT